MLLGLLALAACGRRRKPFEHDDADDAPVCQLPSRTRSNWRSRRPRNMPPAMANRVAAALAIELQSYGIVAAVQPAPAPIQVTGTMSTRDAGDTGIEIQIDWRIDGKPKSQDPAISRRARDRRTMPRRATGWCRASPSRPRRASRR